MTRLSRLARWPGALGGRQESSVALPLIIGWHRSCGSVLPLVDLEEALLPDKSKPLPVAFEQVPPIIHTLDHTQCPRIKKSQTLNGILALARDSD